MASTGHIPRRASFITVRPIFLMVRCSSIAAAVAVTTAALLVPHASACSDFMLNSSVASNVLSARTMDFNSDLESVVEVIPRGTSFQEPPVADCPSCPDYEWKAKYGFVAFNLYGMNVAADGLNEKGLSAAWLYLEGTEYPVHTESDSSKDNVTSGSTDGNPIVTSLCTYLLGNFATVEDVRAGLDSFDVGESDGEVLMKLRHMDSAAETRAPLHVSVHDAEGKSLVLEFMHGKVKVYDNTNGVLTNPPPLPGQLKALAKNGFTHIPGGYTSTERFIRVSVLNHHAPNGYTTAVRNASYMEATDEQRGVSTALHIINTVVRPVMTEATQYMVVRDHGRRKLYFQSTQNQVLRAVDLNALEFGSPASRRLIPVTIGDWFVDVTSALTDESNTKQSMDMLPRSVIDALLHNNGSLPTFVPPTPGYGLDEKLAAAMKPAVTEETPGFGLGLLAGVVLGVMSALVVQAVMGSRRRSQYVQIPA